MERRRSEERRYAGKGRKSEQIGRKIAQED
jgi:hypothetical protein